MRAWFLKDGQYHWQTGDHFDLAACGAHPLSETTWRSRPAVRQRCVSCHRAWRNRNGRKRLPRQNAKRKAERLAVQFGPQADLCRKSRCCACGALPPNDPHHWPSRGAGGTDEDTSPLCRSCHDFFHANGLEAFEQRFGVNLAAQIRRMRALTAREQHTAA